MPELDPATTDWVARATAAVAVWHPLGVALTGERLVRHAGLAPLVDLPGGDAVVRLDLALGEQGDEAGREGDAALMLRSLHQTLTFLLLKLTLRG